MTCRSPLVLAVWLLVSLWLPGCTRSAAPTPAVSPPAEQPALDAATTLPPVPTPIPTPPSPSPAPTRTPAPTPDPSPTPHPLAAFTLAALRERSFPAGPITLGGLLAENEAFKTAAFSYPSDGLAITGLAHVPAGDGPFPLLILLHGYYNRDAYFSGAGTWQSADYFARRGYLVLAPDLRSWGGSEAGLSLFHMGLVADVLHLLAALPSLPMADPYRVGLWGHSMGGGLATKVLVVDDRVRAAVLYAPNSADDADLIARWGRGCLPGESEAAGDFCNPAEIIPAGTPPEVIEAYLAAAADPDFLQQVAPLYHLERVGAPVQIHVGLDDGTGLAETPPDWSARLVEGLEAAGRDVTYFTYPDQGHFFSGESWVTLHERSVALFDDHVKKAP